MSMHMSLQDTLGNFLGMYFEQRMAMQPAACSYEVQQLQRTLGRIMNAYVAFRTKPGVKAPGTALSRKGEEHGDSPGPSADD